MTDMLIERMIKPNGKHMKGTCVICGSKINSAPYEDYETHQQFHDHMRHTSGMAHIDCIKEYEKRLSKGGK